MIPTSIREFVSDVKAGQFTEAIASMIEACSVRALMKSRDVIEGISYLGPEDQAKLFDWSRTASSKSMSLPLAAGARAVAEAVARHEVGHAVIACAMGFRIDERGLSIRVLSENGDHVGMTTMLLDRHTATTKDVIEYLEQRVIVLMAGAMAEAASVNQIGKDFDAAFAGAGTDNLQTSELMRVSLNIQGKLSEQDVVPYRAALRARTSGYVMDEYELIATIARRLADRIQVYGTGIGCSADEFYGFPEIQQRFGQKPGAAVECSIN